MTEDLSSTAIFEPLERSTLAEDIAARILQLIEEKRLQPGDRLPSERQLAATLGVSRPILREALRALSIMNITDTRSGEGTFVTSLDTDLLVGHLGFVLALDDSTFLQLFEARKILEPGIAMLAAERITEAEVAALEDCLRRAEAALEDHDAFLEMDIQLHTQLTRAASNPILTRFMVSLGELTRASRLRTVQIPGVAEETLEDHRRIVGAVERRDGEAAREAVLLHLDHVESRLERMVTSGQDGGGDGRSQ
jgi:GntR family transcriptional repressor for pyruvate dehydrogenase complex